MSFSAVLNGTIKLHQMDQRYVSPGLQALADEIAPPGQTTTVEDQWQGINSKGLIARAQEGINIKDIIVDIYYHS